MKHFLKYNAIGLINTGLTIVVFVILHQWLSVDKVAANFIGYVIGGANSYLMNKHWNFKSQGRNREELPRFLVIFGICYVVNLGVLLIANSFFEPYTDMLAPIKPGTVAHLIANGVYVLMNFTLLKLVVFRVRKKPHTP